MTAEKVGRNGLTPIYKSATRSHAPMDAETFKTLAGRAKWLSEMATGETGGDAAHEPSTALNPNGRLGHDHSGPPYGSAIQHPVFSWGGTNSEAQFTVDDGTSSYVSSFFIKAGLASERDSVDFVAECHIRPFPEYDDALTISPYQRIYLYASWISTPGAANVTVTTWTNQDDARSSDTLVTSAARLDTDTGTYWNVKSGLNKLYGRFETTDATDGVVIYAFSGNQKVKRSH